jgi:hypothetical protein
MGPLSLVPNEPVQGLYRYYSWDASPVSSFDSGSASVSLDVTCEGVPVTLYLGL